MAQILFNRINIQNKLGNSLTQRRFANIASLAAKSRFNNAKVQMLEEYDSHPAIMELEAGPNIEGGFLQVGNLFSFFGFYQDETPAADLRNYIEKNIKMNNNPRFIRNKNNVVYEFDVEVPTLQQVYDEFPMPDQWSSNSWVKALDNGIGTFSYYIFRLFGFMGRSRSGTGLQNKNKVKDRGTDKVLGIKFLPTLLKNFKSYFKS